MFKLLTDRLILRDLTESDLADLLQLSNDPDITKYMDYIKFDSEQKAKEWLDEKIQANNANPRKGYNFAIITKDSNKFVGWIGIGKPSDPKKGDLDFGYAIKKEFWGNGYATEALKAVIDFGFRELGVKKIFGECHYENAAIQKVMTKAGMKFKFYYFEKHEKNRSNEKNVRYDINNYVNEPWSYWDFVQPFRRGDRRIFTSRRWLFLLLQMFTSLVFWLAIRDLLPGPTGFHSKGNRPYTIADILIVGVWFGVAYVYWRIYCTFTPEKLIKQQYVIDKA